MSTSPLHSPPHAGESVADYKVDLTRLIYMLYMDLEQQLARCDVKANLILTANSILLAVAASISVNYLKGPSPGANLLLAAILLVPMLLLSGLAIQSALSVAYPRLHAALPDGGSPPRPSLFFSGQIASLSADDYLASFMATGLDDVKRQAILGAHAKAAILSRKYALVRRGIRATFAAFAFWVAFILMTAL